MGARGSITDMQHGCTEPLFSTVPQLLAFERRVIETDRLARIESTCLNCGAKIVGSIAFSLQRDEADHMAECHYNIRSR